MTMLNTRDAAVAHASRHLVSSEASDALSERLEQQLIMLFAKDPELAEAKVWDAAHRCGIDSETVHEIIAEFRVY